MVITQSIVYNITYSPAVTSVEHNAEFIELVCLIFGYG